MLEKYIDKHEPAIDDYSINERIAAVRKQLGMNQEEFGRWIGLSTTSVWNIEKKNTLVSVQTIRLLYYEYDVNVDYLLYGKGEPIITDRKYSDEMMSLFESMTHEEREVMLKIIKLLLDTPRFHK